MIEGMASQFRKGHSLRTPQLCKGCSSHNSHLLFELESQVQENSRVAHQICLVVPPPPEQIYLFFSSHLCFDVICCQEGLDRQDLVFLLLPSVCPPCLPAYELSFCVVILACVQKLYLLKALVISLLVEFSIGIGIYNFLPSREQHLAFQLWSQKQDKCYLIKHNYYDYSSCIQSTLILSPLHYIFGETQGHSYDLGYCSMSKLHILWYGYNTIQKGSVSLEQ